MPPVPATARANARPSPIAAERSSCSSRLAMARPRRSCSRMVSPSRLMVELVRAGLASARAEHTVAGKQKIEVAVVRITEAGRRALGRD